MRSKKTAAVLADKEFYIPFAAAVFAVGISQKRVRNWLDNKSIYLDANEQRIEDGKHRRFSELDVIRLGLIARLTQIGFSAEEASEFIEDIFKIWSETPIPGFSPRSKRDKLLGVLCVFRLTIHWDEDDEQWKYLGAINKAAGDSITELQDMTIHLNISLMVQTMYRRLEAAGLIPETKNKKKR